MASKETGQPVSSKRTKILNGIRGKTPNWIRRKPPTTAHQSVIAQPSHKSAVSLWEKAYEELQNDDAKLVKQYEDLEKLVLKDTQADPSSKNRMDCVVALGLRQSKEGQLRIAGHSVKETLAKAAEVVEGAKGWIDQAVEASPQASIAWSIISLGIPFLTYPASADKDCKEGFKYTVSRIQYYTGLESDIMKLGSHVEPTIIDFYKTVLDYQIRSVLRFYRNSFKTFIRDLVQNEDWKDMLAKLTAKEKQLYRDTLQSSSLVFRDKLCTINTAVAEIDEKMELMIKGAEQQSQVQTAIRDNTKEIVEQQKELLQHVVTDDERKCLQLFRLSDNPLGHDQSYEAYKKRNSCRVEGTCLWFLNHTNFHEWLARDSGPLFVTADPGCGKSVLAAYLIDDVLPQPVCYFFFKDQVQGRSSQALCALLHQMLSKKPELIRLVKPTCDFNGPGLVTNVTLLWELFCKVSDNFGPLTIVLDALDECDKEDRRDLLINLKKHLGQTKVKFLLTSRPYERVTDKLQGLVREFPNIRIPGEELSDEISPEINLVITARVSQLAEEMQLKDQLRDHIRARLLEVPQRTYLWVYLVLDYLEAGFKKTSGGFDEHIKCLPTTVNEAYERILLQSGLSNSSSRARIILNLLLGAKRTLKIEELQVALELIHKPYVRSSSEIQLEDIHEFKKTLRRECGLLLAFQDDDVYFLHQTVREFLLGSSSKMNWHGSFDLCGANDVCTAACVNRLLLNNTSSTSPNGLITDSRTIAHKYFTSKWWSLVAEPPKSNEDRASLKFYHAVSEAPLSPIAKSYAIIYWLKHLKMYQRCGSHSKDLNEKVLKLRDQIVSEFKQCFSCEATVASINMSAQDKGFTIMHLAVLNAYQAGLGSDPTIIRGLSESGVDINVPDNAGRTPLHLCVSVPSSGAQLISKSVWSGQEPQKLARLLLICGADPKICDHDGRTPLHLLILEREKHSVDNLINLATILIEAKSDLEIRDRTGKTALDYAVAAGNETIIKLLRNPQVSRSYLETDD